MKHHIFIALGLLLGSIFFVRGMEAISKPGLGLQELYILGGFVLSGALVMTGIRQRNDPE